MDHKAILVGLLVIAACASSDEFDPTSEPGMEGEASTGAYELAPSSPRPDDLGPLHGEGFNSDFAELAGLRKFWGGEAFYHASSVRVGFSDSTFCSGMLLNDQTILTSGHCVDQFTTTNSGSFTISLGVDHAGPWTSFGSFSADFWYVSNTYTNGDLAIIRTDDWIGNGIDTDNFALISRTSSVPTGTQGSFGYGYGSPTNLSSTVQRRATNSVDSTSTKWYSVSGGTGLACDGDSGAPALVVTGSDWDLARGIHSDSDPVESTGRCAQNSSASQFKANVGNYATWIADTLSNDSDNDFKCANWTTPNSQSVKWCWQLK